MTPRSRRSGPKVVVDKALEGVENAKEKVGQTLTCTWDQLPLWQRDNPFIISGYRPESKSFKNSAASLLYFHNETINIYSHLFGAIVLLLVGFFLYDSLKSRYPTATAADIYTFATFLFSAATCFMLSATCHLIANHSVSGARFGSQLDYLGIVVFIVGTCMSAFYYGFRLHPTLMYIYWGMMLIVGTLCAITAMNDKFHTPQWRPVRASVFIGLGMFSIFPLIHGTWLYGYTALEERMGLRWSWLQSTLYILGCGFFASCVPERWYPGRYDLVGASHQIFHFCALAAATAQLKALLTAFDHLHGTGETIGHY